MNLTTVIETRPDVRSGKPCFVGTRIAVDEDALVGARRGGWISGGGLDVFAEEPGPDGHPPYGLDNFVRTAHIGGRVEEAMPRSAAIMAGEMRTALRGGRPNGSSTPTPGPPTPKGRCTGNRPVRRHLLDLGVGDRLTRRCAAR